MAVIDEVDTANVVPPSFTSSPHGSLPDELSYLITSFVPNNDHGKRSKAYLVLASYCQGARDGGQDPGTEDLSRVFLPIVQDRITEAQEIDVLAGLSFLAALFQVDWQAASDIFQRDVVLTSITETLDLYPSELVSRGAARLLSQACGHKACRSSLPAEVHQWLEAAVRQKKDLHLRAAAAVAIIKLSRGAGADAPVDSAGVSRRSADRDLVELMKGILADDGQDTSVDAVEGLTYMSVDPFVKENLSNDSAFLKKLFSFIPARRGASSTPSDAPNNSLIYGILSIIHNLSVYRPPLSPEQEQIMKLRQMTRPGTASSGHVRDRGKKLVKNGALNVLPTALRSADSQGVRLIVSQILLNLSADKENRGKILQSGGARTLTEIIRNAFSAISHEEQAEVGVATLEPIQALAKLAITSSPTQVFGPDPGAIYDAIRPLSALLTHSASSRLQRFEALMALTNISSHSVEAASRVAQADGLVTKIEFLMLEDHVLVRRAATELTCNLMSGSESVFSRYSDGHAAKSRLHILVALSDVEDLPTRLAASGALASLTTSPDACRSLYDLERDHHRVLSILTTLIDPLSSGSESDDSHNRIPPDPGSVHRGVVSIRNFFANLDPTLRKSLKEETDLRDLTNALIAAIKANAGSPEILRPTSETLKSLMDLGVVIPGI
ncbi:armadillo-type protein [Lactifluus volemus]|nr:armadillo-type protein [Lactifluus volemus]